MSISSTLDNIFTYLISLVPVTNYRKAIKSMNLMYSTIQLEQIPQDIKISDVFWDVKLFQKAF